jgi:hypothetical protein
MKLDKMVLSSLSIALGTLLLGMVLVFNGSNVFLMNCFFVFLGAAFIWVGLTI